MKKENVITRQYSNAVILNKNISDTEIGVYVSLALCMSNSSDYIFCSPEIVYMTMRGKECSKGSYSTLLNAISSLSKADVVDLRQIRKSLFVANKNQFVSIKDNFVSDDIQNLKAIMEKTDTKISFSVLRFWLSLLTTIYSQTKYGRCTLKNLSSMLNLSVNTILKYTKILEDLKILYVYRSNKYTVDSQYRNFKKITNIYGRYQDKEEIEKIGRDFEEQHAAEQTANAASPSLRSESMKYSHWCKGTHYELSELKTIYSAMKTQNEMHERSGHTDRVKDLSTLEAEIKAGELTYD